MSEIKKEVTKILRSFSHGEIEAWKIILLGVITLIAGVYTFLKTVYGSDLNTLGVFSIIFGCYMLVSTFIKMHQVFSVSKN